MKIPAHYKLLLSLVLLLLTVFQIRAQDVEYKRSSIKTGIGIGVNSGKRETGFGLLYAVGWQKSLDLKERLRINPNLTFGGFSPFIMTDTPDQFYRLTSLGLNLHYDLVKGQSVALVLTGGAFVNYTRGLMGTGGYHQESNSSEYFNYFYFGGNVSAAIRIAPEDRQLAFEIRPLSIEFGTNGFFLAYAMFGLDIKLRK